MREPVTGESRRAIDRPVAEVFRFHAVYHVRNHPRWDPDIQLEQLSGGPIGVGTLIRRSSTRSGTLVEGTMEVEFEPERVVGMKLREGADEMTGWAAFESESESRTILTIGVEIPGTDESMDTTALTGAIARSLRNIKELIESEE